MPSLVSGLRFRSPDTPVSLVMHRPLTGGRSVSKFTKIIRREYFVHTEIIALCIAELSVVCEINDRECEKNLSNLQLFSPNYLDYRRFSFDSVVSVSLAQTLCHHREASLMHSICDASACDACGRVTRVALAQGFTVKPQELVVVYIARMTYE